MRVRKKERKKRITKFQYQPSLVLAAMTGEKLEKEKNKYKLTAYHNTDCDGYSIYLCDKGNENC